ncbi:MAG TPA: electron transfer flavoprotein subunit alpha, partial [Cytophagales bacterium]|nr:electron transfer flavoprotein subunit alpha [Cytophagales bacterium]
LESADGKVRKTSLEAVSYAVALGKTVTAIALGAVNAEELALAGKYGASKVLHAADERLNQPLVKAYASVIGKAMQDENAELLILANSSLGTPVAAKVAVKTGAAFVSNVVELPDTSSGFSVKRSIYTGKAFARVELKSGKKVLTLRKNAAELKETGGQAEVKPYAVSLSEADFNAKITSTEKATGE